MLPDKRPLGNFFDQKKSSASARRYAEKRRRGKMSIKEIEEQIKSSVDGMQEATRRIK